MSKRFSDTEKWDQIWLKKLTPEHKLVWMYLESACDHAGIWKIDVPDLLDKTGLERINIKEFIEECNKDFDKFTGEPIERERIKIVNNCKLWLTGFIQFQYSKKDGSLPANSVVVSALDILKAHSLLIEADNKGFLRVPKGYEGFEHPSIRVKDKDKDRSIKKEESKNKEKPEIQREDGFLSLLENIETHEEAFEIWNKYRKKKGKHASLYEKEVLIKKEWRDMSPKEVAEAILYTVKNGWVTLQYPEEDSGPSKSEETPMYLKNRLG